MGRHKIMPEEVPVVVFKLRLREIMIDRRIKPRDLADMVGVSKSAIYAYCTGTAMPDAVRIYKLSKALNASSDYLLGLSEDPYYEGETSDTAKRSAQTFVAALSANVGAFIYEMAREIYGEEI